MWDLERGSSEDNFCWACTGFVRSSLNSSAMTGFEIASFTSGLKSSVSYEKLESNNEPF